MDSNKNETRSEVKLSLQKNAGGLCEKMKTKEIKN